MNKLKTLLTLGIVSVATCATAIPSHALSTNTTQKCTTNSTCNKTKSKGVVHLYINGKEYKFIFTFDRIDKKIVNIERESD